MKSALAKYYGITLVLLFLLPISPALGSLLSPTPSGNGFESTFDKGLEGWRYYMPNQASPTNDGMGDLHWGNGSAYNFNAINEPWMLISPEWGDWSGLYGGKIQFDLKVQGAGDFHSAGGVLILDLPGKKKTFASHRFNITKKDAWVTYEFDILDSVFDKYGANVENPDIPISGRMHELERLLITGNWLQGDETVYLDNVKVKAVPLPATLVLVSTGLLGVIGAARRKLHK